MAGFRNIELEFEPIATFFEQLFKSNRDSFLSNTSAIPFWRLQNSFHDHNAVLARVLV
jgi:hypothetical protein